MAETSGASVYIGFPKGLLTLWSGQGLKVLAGCGTASHIMPSSVSHRVNLETVSTVSKEGHALQVKAAPFIFRCIAFANLS